VITWDKISKRGRIYYYSSWFTLKHGLPTIKR
jgi:hypothetical protein